MPLKIIDATEAKQGAFIIIDGEPCSVRSMDKSKSGKHGAAKCRIEAIGVTDDKKRIIAVPGSHRFEVPLIDKRKGQVLSIDKTNKKANIMDLESFETFDAPISSNFLDEIEENMNVEYWNIENKLIIQRKN